MTIADINSYVSFRANTNTTEYTAANRLISTNRWYQKIADMILQSDDGNVWDDLNAGTEAIITKNLTANQGYVSLALSDKILKIQRVEISYDLVNWYKAEPITQGEIGLSIATQTNINNYYQTTKPYYEVRGLYMYVYPVPTSSQTAAVKIWVQREPAEFTSGEVTTGTKVPGFDAPWHAMIALGMAYDWFVAKKLFNDSQLVQAELNDYENRLRTAYGAKDDDRHWQFKGAVTNYN